MCYYALLMMINWWKITMTLWKLNFIHIKILNDVACNLNSNWIWINLSNFLNLIWISMSLFQIQLDFNSIEKNGMKIGVEGI
jgi:hypothetical protein